MRLANLTDERLAEVALILASDPSASGIMAFEIVSELIDRRAEASSELRSLERSLAYENAATTIDSNCGGVGPFHDWYDLDEVNEYARDCVTAAAQYLELRGLLERDATNHNHVSIRNESEATA